MKTRHTNNNYRNKWWMWCRASKFIMSINHQYRHINVLYGWLKDLTPSYMYDSDSDTRDTVRRADRDVTTIIIIIIIIIIIATSTACMDG